jgi:hypothetical protein
LVAVTGRLQRRHGGRCGGHGRMADSRPKGRWRRSETAQVNRVGNSARRVCDPVAVHHAPGSDAMQRRHSIRPPSLIARRAYRLRISQLVSAMSRSSSTIDAALRPRSLPAGNSHRIATVLLPRLVTGGYLEPAEPLLPDHYLASGQRRMDGHPTTCPHVGWRVRTPPLRNRGRNAGQGRRAIRR